VFAIQAKAGTDFKTKIFNFERVSSDCEMMLFPNEEIK
jgi:hypothetical protein